MGKDKFQEGISMNEKHNKWFIQYRGYDGHWRTYAASFRTKSLAILEMEKMNNERKEGHTTGVGEYRVKQA